MIDDAEAFVYLWYDSKNKMYYLGKHKGSPDDGYTHSSTIWESFNKNNIPEGVRRRILATGTHEEMIVLENELLVNRYKKCWGRYYNRSLGDIRFADKSGELNGMYGKTHTPESRKKISKAASDRFLDKEYMDHHKKKMRDRWTDEEREKASDKRKELFADDEYRIKHSEAQRLRYSRSEEREKASIRQKEYYKHNPMTDEVKNKISKATKGRVVSAETRKKKSIVGKERYSDPENRKKTSEALKEYHKNNPRTDEHKKKLREAQLRQPKVICHHCKREFTKQHYTQWHGDKCKERDKK